jgi:DNA-binding MarR family transcriptional regulator
MPATPPLTGQHIGEAENAIRAVLDALLAETETTFHQWVALRVLAATDSGLELEQLVQRMTSGLKVEPSSVLAAVGQLDAGGLVTVRDEDVEVVEVVGLTDAGRARHRRIQDGVDRITRQLYGDLPVDDLVTTRRVLAIVTERANAVFAG